MLSITKLSINVILDSVKILSIMAFRMIMVLSIKLLRMRTFNIKTVSIMTKCKDKTEK
jgi:hypothetical protein